LWKNSLWSFGGPWFVYDEFARRRAPGPGLEGHMLDGRGMHPSARRVPVLGASPGGRRLPRGRTLVSAAIAVGSVGLFFLVPDSLVVGRPSFFGLLLALLVGLLVYVMLENRSESQELRAARVRSTDARDLERQRIQRDLHDSAQQRIVSARIHLGLLGESVLNEADRSTIEQVGHDLDEALKEIGSVTHEGYPQLLVASGVVASLRAAVASAPVPVRVEARGFGRYSGTIERNVYFCCMEALQNVVKHAGRNARARIRLIGTRDRIVFQIDDTGIGFDPDRVQPGEGLVNLADRVSALHGRLTVDSRPGMGTRIRGEVPVA
jgi:signal transduction histidine kinase